MNIILKEVTSGKPYEEHPQLKTIWPSPYIELAMEATEEHLLLKKEYPELDIGKIFLILEDENVIGITGYFIYTEDDSFKPYNKAQTHFGLRWHGILPEHRNHKKAKLAFTKNIEQIIKHYDNPLYITELVPKTEYGEALFRHFSTLGFIISGNPEKYDWADFKWQPITLNIQQFILQHNNSNIYIQKQNHKKNTS